jgi:DNA repair protein RAD50
MTATRNLQVTTKKTGGLTFKTLEGILAKTDVGDDNKVSGWLRVSASASDHMTTAKYYLDQVLGDG